MLRRGTIVLATVALICLLCAPVVLAAGGSFIPPPDKTGGPDVDVWVVMEGPQVPTEPTYRLFTMRVQKGRHSQSAIFTGNFNYLYGCQQSGSPDLKTSTEGRFIGFVNSWAPSDVIEALIGPVGDPYLAAITRIDHISCTRVGDNEYLSFSGRIRFAK